ncbi:polysaccharide biosynthesis C-terminal domain-containing protein, partial [Candidatus Microgenomates bacterium]|nr:polysaccharide biosynthesis C-terminal domain-containing protein [Candidatus Microgenomates bacterium]
LLESLPMGGILVLFTIYNRVDTVILQYFKGSAAVGLYGVAYRVFEVLVLGAAYFANSILPLISSLAKTDRRRLGEVYRKSFVVLLVLGVTVATVNFIFAPLAIAILGGGDFAPSVGILRLLSLALLMSYFNHLNGYTLIALGKQWYSLTIAVIALTVNLTLNWLFIPLFSYQAAAFITFVTEGLIVVLSLIFIKRELGVIPSLGDVPKVILELVAKRGKIFEV